MGGFRHKWRWAMGFRPVLVAVLAAFTWLPAGAEELPADLAAELSDIEDQLTRFELAPAKITSPRGERALADLKQRIEDFSIDAELLDDDPRRVRLDGRWLELSNAANGARARRKQEHEAKRMEAARKFEEIEKIEPPVDLANVSFRRDVAPIVVNACFRCHRGENPPGDFNAGTFASFVEQISPGDPEGSHLLNLVTGKAEPKMPRGNQNQFSRKWIEIWTAWIKQGAKFDGPDPKAPIADYMIDFKTQRQEAVAKMSEETLEGVHEVYARRHLATVNPKRPARISKTDNFLIVSTLGDDDTHYAGVLAEAVIEGLKEKFRLSADKPIWRGKLGLYLFADRFDYVAFAREIDAYVPEDSQFGHARQEPEYAYVALTTRGFGSELDEPISRQLIAAFLGTLGEGKLPNWAVYGYARAEAEGVGARPKEELALAARLFGEGRTLADLFGEKLPWEQLGALSTGLFAYLKQNDPKLVAPFLRTLAEDGDCVRATKDALGTTEETLSRAVAAWVTSRARR